MSHWVSFVLLLSFFSICVRSSVIIDNWTINAKWQHLRRAIGKDDLRLCLSSVCLSYELIRVLLVGWLVGRKQNNNINILLKWICHFYINYSYSILNWDSSRRIFYTVLARLAVYRSVQRWILTSYSADTLFLRIRHIFLGNHWKENEKKTLKSNV